jgi:hypothetical protein
MAKKKSNEPKRQFTKHQPTGAQQHKRKQRILLITAIVYCRKCLPPYPCNLDPPGAAAVMRNLGFEEVYNMGGVIQWEAEGYPLVP